MHTTKVSINKGDNELTVEEKVVLQRSQRYSKWLSQKMYYSVVKTNQRTWTIKRGEVYFVDLGQNIGSEENKIRPIVVLQANAYNFKSPVFTCAIISSSPITIPDVQVPIINTYQYENNVKINQILEGTIDLGQIKTIAKERIVSKKVCRLESEMEEIDKKLLNIFGLSNQIRKRDNIITSLMGKVNYLQGLE